MVVLFLTLWSNVTAKHGNVSNKLLGDNMHFKKHYTCYLF